MATLLPLNVINVALAFYHLKMETIVYFLVLDIFINVQNVITSLQRIGYIGIYT